jgi:predicted CXXCH cytochrome family protein
MKCLPDVLFLLGLTGLPLAAQMPGKTEILNSKHDFRASASATIRSTAGQDACVFCHTPHNADPGAPLWNHRLPMGQFPVYQSSTMKANVSPMSAQDSSKLCLICHDGTIALGDTVNDGLIPFLQGGNYTLPASSPSNLAGGNRGFSDDHPFAFALALGTEIRTPAGGDPVRLDQNGRLQCVSCHQPHREDIDPTVRKFLVKANDASAICLSCHVKVGWANSAHRLPPDPAEDLRYTQQQGAHTGYIGVSRNACESCHRPHSPQIAQRLVKFPEENTCYQCHDGSVANPNIKSEFPAKRYIHPVSITPSVHDAAESPTSPISPLPETNSGTPRHTECVDCHNPHYSNTASAQPPSVNGALAGTSGISVADTFLPQSASEYEICFKCHADSANKPQLFDMTTVGIGYGRNPQRQFDAGNPNRFNTRLEFEFSLSHHPVTRAQNLSTGPGGDVPSLRIQPVSPGGAPLPGRTLSATSLIYCTDCHNSDTGRNLTGFAGPRGPHGSNIPHLLERTNGLEVPPAVAGGSSPGVSYSPADYALCDKCHDVTGSILHDQSFKEHSKHIRGENAACSTCHDPHASSAPMLINFDRSIVGPSGTGRLEYQRTGFRHGACYLRCHGEDHNPERY